MHVSMRKSHLCAAFQVRGNVVESSRCIGNKKARKRSAIEAVLNEYQPYVILWSLQQTNSGQQKHR